MTICIGFPFNKGLLLASDSQMSLGGKYKQHDEPKVSSIKFGNFHYAGMAIAGSLDAARDFQEILESESKNVSVSHARSIADLAEAVLKKTRNRLIGYISDNKTNAEERAQKIMDSDFEVILAYYFGAPLKPYIYHLRLSHGLAVKGVHQYESIGCGSDVAGLILSGSKMADLTNEEAVCLAYYTVEACKKFDQACGGPVQHILINEDPSVEPLPMEPNALKIIERVVKEKSESIQNLITQYIVSGVYDAYLEEIEPTDPAD